MPQLDLTNDELLTTTRAVRRRLDLTRPVERELVEECLAIAHQAPTGSFRQHWRYVVVTDAATRAALGELYRRGWQAYRDAGLGAGSRSTGDAAADAAGQRIAASSAYLAEHMGEVPVLVVPCIMGRTDGAGVTAQASAWGSILPGVWSFMLAARSRGLGTAWTTLHLAHEREAAELLGIPYDDVMQAALIPLAHTVGTSFRPGPREPLERSVRWERW